MDALLPLTVADWPRFQRVLRPSLERHFEPLKTCWVVMPESDAAQFAEYFRGGRFRLVAEPDLVSLSPGELKRIETVGEETGAGRGWFVQQIVKLVGASLIETDFYLTLDADVICTRQILYSDLVHEGRARTAVHYSDIHSGWYWWTENAFGFQRRGGEQGRTHAVTPVVLNAKAVALLSAELCGSSSLNFEEGSREMLAQNHEQFVSILVERLPWTEYALYFSFLETRGLFERYHVDWAGSLYGNCIWTKNDLATWDPSKSFAADAPFFFTIIQSNSVSIEELFGRLQAYADLFIS